MHHGQACKVLSHIWLHFTISFMYAAHCHLWLFSMTVSSSFSLEIWILYSIQNSHLYESFLFILSFFFLSIFIFIYFLLKCSWFTMLLVSGAQPSDSVLYMYIYAFQICFPYRLLQNIKYSSLWLSVLYIVGPCWLSVFYMVVCIC